MFGRFKDWRRMRFSPRIIPLLVADQAGGVTFDEASW